MTRIFSNIRIVILLIAGGCCFLQTTLAIAWDHHDLITRYSTEPLSDKLVKWKKIAVVPMDQALRVIFADPKKTIKLFVEEYQLNPKIEFPFGRMKDGKMIAKHPSPGEWTSAAEVLSHYADEPDWGMDRELNLSPDQRFTGGYTGPTSQGFRHLYYRRWQVTSPLVTFHIPPRELGEAPWQVYRWFELSKKAFEARQVYWGFRFLAWSLHYLQDLSQPFHTNQLLVADFIAWKSLFSGMNRLVGDTTQIIANYHWLYEAYVSLLLMKENDESEENSGSSLREALTIGNLPLAHLDTLEIALDVSRQSGRLANELGKGSLRFFGKSFQNPTIDVPNHPEQYPTLEYEKKASAETKELIVTNTQKSFDLCGAATRLLVTKAIEKL